MMERSRERCGKRSDVVWQGWGLFSPGTTQSVSFSPCLLPSHLAAARPSLSLFLHPHHWPSHLRQTDQGEGRWGWGGEWRDVLKAPVKCTCTPGVRPASMCFPIPPSPHSSHLARITRTLVELSLYGILWLVCCHYPLNQSLIAQQKSK